MFVHGGLAEGSMRVSGMRRLKPYLCGCAVMSDDAPHVIESPPRKHAVPVQISSCPFPAHTSCHMERRAPLLHAQKCESAAPRQPNRLCRDTGILFFVRR